ncbi:hypothetical protein DH2020_000970 [Rehmannia glutinosa]|uniref:Peptidase metallopeptidase domain-containing protein n=1 Tax=Rehmannia glutinosa TaxID=99300 RepID=A0ABR0XXZ8_REHGL
MNYTNPTDSNYRNDDVFDNTLEEAIKKYQKFYKLKVTGILDPQTVTLMLQPRCGVADLFLTNNSNIKNAASFLYNYKYAFSGYSWPPNKRNLTISFPTGTRKDAYAPVEFALTRWGNVSPFKFTYIDNFDLSEVKISFERRDHGDGYPFDGPYGILAHSFFPSDGRLHFDGDENWTTYDEKGNFDLQTVALHELGHILGLAHSQDPKALMFAYIGRGETKDITPDDIQGIKSLYPNN